MDGLAEHAAGHRQVATSRLFYADYLYGRQRSSSNAGRARRRSRTIPATDDYHFFRGSDYDDDEARHPASATSTSTTWRATRITDEDSPEDYPTQATTLPTTEDINQDQNLSESESYFQYKVSLRPQDMVVGQNFITDRILATASTPDGTKQVYWYQFKVPVREPGAQW